MVGSGASDRSKEAVGMMALHEALRNVCLNSDWTYSIFWTIRPRPFVLLSLSPIPPSISSCPLFLLSPHYSFLSSCRRVRGGNGCKVGDDSGSLMLMWEDGFCRGRLADCLEDLEGEDPVRKAFSKMSIQLYNYGEGLMGKVASDKCHKWVFKEPADCEPNISNYWQSSFDALPSEWTDQFESGIQTIAVIQAGHGLLQLGSCKIIPEDLHFVLRMRHTFESLGYQSGFYLSQLFSSARNTSPSSSVPLKQPSISTRPSQLFNWAPRAMPSTPTVLTSQDFQSSVRLGIPPSKDDSHLFLLPHSSDSEAMMGDHASDVKWPNGLSFFNALAGRGDDSRLFFNIGNKMDTIGGANPNSDSSSLHTNGGANPNEFLSLDCHYTDSVGKMDNKFKRSFTLPARRVSSSSSTSLDQHQNNPEGYRNEAGICSDVMQHFLE